MNSEELLEQLGTRLGIALHLSPKGTCCVLFGKVEVVFEQYESQLFLMATLGSAAGREDVCRHLLEANYLGAQTGQACIGLDAGKNEFVLHRALTGNMTFAEFEEVVMLFVKTAQYWKNWLSTSVMENVRQEDVPMSAFIKTSFVV